MEVLPVTKHYAKSDSLTASYSYIYSSENDSLEGKAQDLKSCQRQMCQQVLTLEYFHHYGITGTLGLKKSIGFLFFPS